MVAVLLICILSTTVLKSFGKGYELYDSNSEICCNGIIASITEFNECCGSTPYNDETWACCGGKVQPFPVEGINHYACCDNPEAETSTAYVKHTHHCCDGTILEKEDSNIEYVCCEGNLYDVSLYQCCGNQLLERQDGYECCHTELYSVKEQICCMVYDDDLQLSVASHALYLKEENRTECCDLEPYDFRKQACCQNELQPKPEDLDEMEWAVCCGDEVITNHNTQICCNGIIMERDGTQYVCCGDKLYDYMSEVCCGTEILPQELELECCLEAGRSFNPEREMCCGSEVILMEDADSPKDSCCWSA